MADRKCAICGKTHDLFPLELKDDDGESFTRFVCGSCWEIIAAIAQKVMNTVKG